MNRISLLLLLTAAFLCAPCSAATFSGRVVTRDGKPVEGARVDAFATPIGLDPATRKQIKVYFSRGSTTTNRAGEFLLRATAAFVVVLFFSARKGTAVGRRPCSKGARRINL
jgi:hypothetical protein